MTHLDVIRFLYPKLFLTDISKLDEKQQKEYTLKRKEMETKFDYCYQSLLFHQYDIIRFMKYPKNERLLHSSNSIYFGIWNSLFYNNENKTFLTLYFDRLFPHKFYYSPRNENRNGEFILYHTEYLNTKWFLGQFLPREYIPWLQKQKTYHNIVEFRLISLIKVYLCGEYELKDMKYNDKQDEVCCNFSIYDDTTSIQLKIKTIDDAIYISIASYKFPLYANDNDFDQYIEFVRECKLFEQKGLALLYYYQEIISKMKFFNHRSKEITSLNQS